MSYPVFPVNITNKKKIYELRREMSLIYIHSISYGGTNCPLIEFRKMPEGRST